MDDLVSTDWLADHLGDRDLRVVDATYHANFPGEPARDARAEHLAAHIPGAMFLDLDSLRDTASNLPNMLPPPEKVARRLHRLGIGDGTRIVLYDDTPHRTSARGWWVLRHHGVGNLAILDGGLAAWRSEGRPLASGEEKVREGHLTLGARRDDAWSKADMLANLANIPHPHPSHSPDGERAPSLSHWEREGGAQRRKGEGETAQILDARSPARFTGAEVDPRPGTAPGHIPGSTNLPYSRLFAPDGKWKRGAALAAAFTDAGVDLDKPVVTTCGSGVTAAVLGFGLHLLGRYFALYDGSWSEWGSDPATPKAITA